MAASVERRFSQVDVFTSVGTCGNPLAVVHDAIGLTDDQLKRFANWTNLSETTFLLPPTEPTADYRVRILTPSRELPFAGHPTLGSCAAWLAAGGVAKTPSIIVQQCGLGLVRIKRDGERLAFAAPPLLKGGYPTNDERRRILEALNVSQDAVRAMERIDNGPGWIGVMLPSAQAVLDLHVDWSKMKGLDVGVVGAYPPDSECQFEVRAFCGGDIASSEDPVTGSLNAGIAQWLIREGWAPDNYIASQGTALGRTGRVYVARTDTDIWIGGNVTPVINGTVRL